MANRDRPPHSRRLRHVPALMLAAAFLAAGCSEQSSAQLLTAESPVLIESSQMFVSIQNRAGLALVDVSVSIVAAGAIEYSKLIPRLENMEKRQIQIADFRSRGGSAFTMGIVRPKSLRLEARDISGRSYEIEVPWQ